MEESRKQQIANSFSRSADQTDIHIVISIDEYKIFEKGIYSGSMDEKWNIFVFNENIYFARSWTDHCIFKILYKIQSDHVILYLLLANRDSKQYKSQKIDDDVIMVKKIIRNILERPDIYIDPELQIPLIKQTLEKEDPFNNLLKSAGATTVGFTQNTYQELTGNSRDFFTVEGWEQLRDNIFGKPENEKLVTVYMHQKNDRSGQTLYFDSFSNELLGQVKIVKKY